jgi:hypothetical protein
VRLAEQWRNIERELPGNWTDARLLLRARDAEESERAAASLTPLMPGRSGNEVRFYTARRGAGAGPDSVRRLLHRLDDEGIRGELELVSAGRPAPGVRAVERRRIAKAWDEALATLPPDWSDLLAELELTSSDHLEQAALQMAPLNPTRFGSKPALRFRVAQRFGYGASPGMVRRCLERVDEEKIEGQLGVLRVLSDTDPVSTQGPVWYVEGKAV